MRGQWQECWPGIKSFSSKTFFGTSFTLVENQILIYQYSSGHLRVWVYCRKGSAACNILQDDRFASGSGGLGCGVSGGLHRPPCGSQKNSDWCWSICSPDPNPFEHLWDINCCCSTEGDWYPNRKREEDPLFITRSIKQATAGSAPDPAGKSKLPYNFFIMTPDTLDCDVI